MTHDEFMDTYHEGGGYYIVPELNDKVYSRNLSRRLKDINLTVESWYNKYVPNPGCSICGNPVGLHKLSRGWYVTCSAECESAAYSLRQCATNAVLWNDPEQHKNLYLRMSRSKGITHAYVYVLDLGFDVIKFGASYDPDRRAYELHGDLIDCSRLLLLEEAAELECSLAKKFPNVVPFDCVDGKHEVRSKNDLPLILEYLKDFK